MPVVRPYPLADVAAQGIPNVAPNVAAAGDVGLFGGNQARDLQQAGANLDRTSDNVFGIYQQQAKEMNDTRVEGDVNSFIEQKQKALGDFVQLRGQDAIQGSQAVTDGLIASKKQLMDSAANPYQRDLLARRLDAQMLDATGTVTAHTARESRTWQVDTVKARSDLTVRQGVMERDDPSKIDAQLGVMATIGLEQARLAGAPPDSDIAKAAVLKEQEKLLVGVIQAKITDGNKRAALALYDKYPNVLKHNAGVDSVMKGVRTEIDGENVANSALAKMGLPQIRSGEAGTAIGNLPPAVEMRRPQIQKAADTTGAPAPLIAGVMAQESGGRDDAVSPAGARGPMQLMPGTARDLGVDNPHDASQAVPAGARYLKAQLDKYGDEKTALMAYNWGPGNVDNWIKAGSDPSKVPAETRDYVGRVQGYAARFGTAGVPTYKGDLKAGYEQAASEIQNRTDLSPEVRANALATLTKTSTQITSYIDSSTKALKDEADSYRLRGYLNPAALDPAKLASFADRASALGNQSLADTYRVFASLAPSLKDGLQSLPADQFKLLQSMEEGPAKKLLEGISSGNAETLTQADEAASKLRQAQKDGLDPRGLKDIATKAAQLYAAGGKSEKARAIGQLYGQMLATGDVLKADPAAQKQALAEFDDIASKGQVNEQQTQLHHLLKDGIAQQQTEFNKDSYAAGRSLYGMPALPLSDGAGRAQQADEISRRRGGIAVAPVTDEEFAAWRNTLDRAPPDAGAKLLQGIAQTYPPGTYRALGAGLAGKADATDPVSRGYAAAFGIMMDGDANSTAIGREILNGVRLKKEAGDSAKKLALNSPAVQAAIQTKLGNAFVDARGVPAMIVDAAEAIYTSRMISAGQSGESVNNDVLSSALDAVVGTPTTRNGQMFIPPKGVDAYLIDGALGALMPADVAGLRTLNGSEVTADKIARYGMLTNATGKDGGDGKYWLKMPDPAQGGRPGIVQKPDGQPYILDIKPLLARVQSRPPAADPMAGLEGLRFGDGDFGDGGEGGRPLWRDAPSIFSGPESSNIEHQNPSSTRERKLIKAEPPPGLELPSAEEMQNRISGERLSALRTETISPADFETQAEYARALRDYVKKHGLRNERK